MAVTVATATTNTMSKPAVTMWTRIRLLCRPIPTNTLATKRPMVSERLRVAVNGYGVTGKRVAEAVGLQDDMELVGIADVLSDYPLTRSEDGAP